MSLFYGEQINKNNGKNGDVKNRQFSISEDSKQKLLQYAKQNPDVFKRVIQQAAASQKEGFGLSSIILPDQKGGEGWCSKLCACTKLEYYQEYFQVTNTQVKDRIKKTIKFWEGKFFQPEGQNYDFYGTFWIYTTIVFCISAVQNIIRYQSQTDFSFNFDIIGAAFGFFIVVGFGFPVALSFLMNCLGIQTKHIQLLCLFGYSSAIYIIGILLCSLNFCMLHWLLIGYCAVSRGISIFRNISHGFEIPTSRKLLITGLIILESLIVFGAIKLVFIHCMDNQIQSTLNHQHQVGGLKLRHYGLKDY